MPNLNGMLSAFKVTGISWFTRFWKVDLVAGLVIMVSIGTWVGWRYWWSPTAVMQTVAESRHWKKDVPFKVSAWAPDWATNPSIASLNATAGQKLTNLSPVWYEVEPNGNLRDKTPPKATELIAASNRQGLELTPTVALFDPILLSTVLNNTDYLTKHVQELIRVGSENRVDGLDLDYEATKLRDKEKFFELLTRVAEGLHARGKIFIVTVLAKWGENIQYKGLRETREVQDWSRIAQIADEVRVMTYDYTGEGQPQLGPIGPLNWQEEVIKYGLSKMPKEKLMLGVHLYAYEKWVEVSDNVKVGDFKANRLTFQTDMDKNLGENFSSRAYNYTQVKQVLQDYSGDTESFQGEKVHRYSKINDQTGKMENRVMVYIDPKGVEQRLQLAKQYGLRGLAFWRLGGEQDLLQSLPTAR